jgi:type IV fimbrial biogenesis protein FimT
MSRRKGFTLVEVVVTVALVAVVSALAVSWSQRWMATMRVTTASGDMMSALLLARSEAVKRRSRVVLCKSPDGATCSDTGGWEQGWIVFHDANNDRVRQGNEPVLSTQPALPGSTRLFGNLWVTNYVSYGAAGSSLTVGGSFQAGTLTVCEQSATAVPAKEIIIALGGRARLNTTTVAECP